MSVSFHTRLLMPAVMCAAASGYFATVAHAQTTQTENYIAVAIEAEAFTTADSRWVVTDSSTAAIEDDPDPNHSDTASGGVYLELLPDIRVTHADPFFGPLPAFWGAPGAGPTLTYTLNFPEAGRYYAHSRAYSTGTEDNGIHFGLNDTWPASGERVQFCSAHLMRWHWRSSQRDSGGNGSCGIENTIYLDIPTAGEHTITISAREDGFELDRIALVKDKSGNTKICFPHNADEIHCKDGSIESADGFVDLSLLLAADVDQVDIGGTINFTATLENLDAFDTATAIEITLSGGAGSVLSSENTHCEADAGALVCSLVGLAPTAPNENELFEFSMTVNEDGEYVVEASATSTETDEHTQDNTVTKSVIFGQHITTTDITTAITASATELSVGEQTTLSTVVTNTGDLTAESVTVSLNVPAGFDVSTIPGACSGTTTLLCALGDLPSQSNTQLDVTLLATQAGNVAMEVISSANNDSDASNNNAPLQLSVIESTTGDTGTTDGDTDGSTDGGTDGTSGDTGTSDDAGGSLAWFMLLAMMAVLSARLNRLNQRDLVISR